MSWPLPKPRPANAPAFLKLPNAPKPAIQRPSEDVCKVELAPTGLKATCHRGDHLKELEVRLTLPSIVQRGDSRVVHAIAAA